MRRPATRTMLGAAALVLLVVVAADVGVPTGPLLEAVVVLGAVLLALDAAGRLAPPQPPRRPTPSADDAEDPRGEAALRRLESAAGSAGGAWFALQPTLRRLARTRCERHGVALDDGDAARALLGAELHGLVAPATGRPVDRDAPGVDPVVLDRVLTRLESL